MSSGIAFADGALGWYTGAAAGVTGGILCFALDIPDEDSKGLAGGLCFGIGGVCLIAGILCQALDIEIAKTETDSPLHYVRFDTNGRDTNLSVKIDY